MFFVGISSLEKGIRMRELTADEMLLVIGGSDPGGYQGAGTNSYGNGRANNAVGSESRDSWDRDHGSNRDPGTWSGDYGLPRWRGSIVTNPSTWPQEQQDRYNDLERSVPGRFDGDRQRSGH